jgi:hypothetical protein
MANEQTVTRRRGFQDLRFTASICITTAGGNVGWRLRNYLGLSRYLLHSKYLCWHVASTTTGIITYHTGDGLICGMWTAGQSEYCSSYRNGKC